jgi:hypothetical protein
VGALAIPTTHNKNEKGGAEDGQRGSGQITRLKLKGQPCLPFNEKTSVNDGKHHRKTKLKNNSEKPETRVRK